MNWLGHTRYIVGPVWPSPYRYRPHYTSMAPCILVFQVWAHFFKLPAFTYIFSHFHTDMVPNIPVWPLPYQYGGGHTGRAHTIPVCWGPYRLHFFKLPAFTYIFSLEDELVGPYWYGPQHTGMVWAIPVWPPPNQYAGDHTGMVRAIPVWQCYWYGPNHTGMVGAILVRWGPYWHGEGHTGPTMLLVGPS